MEQRIAGHQLLLHSRLRDLAVCGLDEASRVVNITPDDVVGEVRLEHQVFGVHLELQYVVSWLYISDINPLAVNVCIIRIVATRAESLCVGGAGVAFEVAEVTGCVLQAETGLVSFSYLPPRADLQQIIVTELIHTVIMLVAAVPLPGVSRSVGHEVSRPLVLHPLRKPQQNSDVVVGGFGGVGRAGETFFLCCTS